MAQDTDFSDREYVASTRQQQGYEAELGRLADTGAAYGAFCTNFLHALCPEQLLHSPAPHLSVTKEQAFELLKMVLTLMAPH